MFRVNTSNPGKLQEYRSYLGDKVEQESQDIREPDADLLTIIRYKASQFSEVLVDDVSLEIEGCTIGPKIKWHLDQLPLYVGRRAEFICLLGITRASSVEIYCGRTRGKLVPPRGQGFGFNSYFLPDEGQKTFGEEIPPQLNARYRAVQKMLAHQPDFRMRILKDWDGPFQDP